MTSRWATRSRSGVIRSSTHCTSRCGVLRDPTKALKVARDVLARCVDDQDEQRRLVLENHVNDFSAAELDAEVGYKKLVTVLGGGGGAGFVYIGGLQRLLAEGHVPDYMIGSSFGSIIGSVVSRALPVPIEDYVAWAKTVSYRAILGPERLRRRHGLTGMFSLRFDEFADAMFRREDGEPMRMSDLAIPFDAVVAGVRRQSFGHCRRFRRPELAALRLRSIPLLPIGIGPQVAARMWQVAAFIDLRVSKPIVIGDDDTKREFNVVDAASFSSAIPGVLHYETSDARMLPLLDDLMAEKGHLCDRRRRCGKQRSRRTGVEASPRREARHPQCLLSRVRLLSPAMGSAEFVARSDYSGGEVADDAQRAVRRLHRPVRPTLSPANLAPSAGTIDRAGEWGRIASRRPFR